MDSSPCPERSAESCRTSFPAAISRMYLPLSESLGSRMWSQISSRVVPALTRSLLSRRFSLNVRANKWLTWLSPSVLPQQAVCLQVHRCPLPQTPLIEFCFQICGLKMVTIHKTFHKYPSNHPLPGSFLPTSLRDRKSKGSRHLGDKRRHLL